MHVSLDLLNRSARFASDKPIQRFLAGGLVGDLGGHDLQVWSASNGTPGRAKSISLHDLMTALKASIAQNDAGRFTEFLAKAVKGLS